MTYLKRTNRRGKQDSLLVFCILLVLAFLFFISYLFPSFYPSVFYPVTSLFWQAESGTLGFFGSMIGTVRSKYNLEAENTRLRQEIQARDTSLFIIDSLKSENEHLKNMLGRSGKVASLLGVILVRPPVSPYDTLVLDVGTSDGVKVGNKVYAEGDVLLGDIAEVYSHQSKVALYSSPGRKTSVLVGTSTIAAEAIGTGGGNFTMKLPATTKVTQGATIALPHIHAHTFGVVENITLDTSDSLMTIRFKSPVNVNEISFVEIEKSI